MRTLFQTRATIAALLLLPASLASAMGPNESSPRFSCVFPLPSRLSVSEVRALIERMQSTRQASLLTREMASSPEVERINQTLLQARKVIVSDCAAPLSIELCWTAGPDSALADKVKNAATVLDNASAAMDALPKNVDDDARRVLRSRLDLLRAFNNIFGAIADADDAKKGKDRLIDACINISVYLDDPNPGVADSARLWQGVAYRKAGRPDRTLKLLWPAIGSISSTRVDFYARVERCRALVDQGQYVSSLALAVKLNERLDDWMKSEDDATKKLAADILLWIRAATYKKWAEALRKEGDADRAKAADDAANKLLGEHPFPAPPDKWLPLSASITGLPEWQPVEVSAATSKPAEKPAE